MSSAIITSLFLMCSGVFAQTTQWGNPTGSVQYPKGNYTELPDPKPAIAEEWSKVKNTVVSWGSTDIRYNKSELPSIKKAVVTESLKGWRGERVSAQAIVWSGVAVEDLSFEITPLSGKNGEIDASASFVRYVMQDNFLTCGFRTASADYDSTLIADPIDHLVKSISMDAMSVRPVWVSVWIPESAVAGNYKGILTIKNRSSVVGKLNLTVDVIDRVLPKPTEWTYHLDLWQNPYAEARYSGLEPYTKEHFDWMRPGYERLRDAGQKVVTTTLMHKPWGGQTEDYFESMVSWMKKSDGEWSFDFTTFDMWVEYMFEIGIDKQIACYSMIPWDMSFKYYDQKSNSMKFIKTTTDTPEYSEVWTALLKSLSKHLHEKGWFEKTTIAMDERSMSDMENAFKIIKDADPNFKVSMAGNYHPEIEAQLYDYCIASDFDYSPEVLADRKAKGKISTYYTCCAQKYPNVFTYSAPAEAEWISWYAAAKGYDGYLRWAYQSYTLEPLFDARFRAFQAGDSFVVYPENRTSIRFEKVIDGIEDFEKVKILRKELSGKGDKKSLKEIDDLLGEFSISNFEKGIKPEVTVRNAQNVINSF